MWNSTLATEDAPHTRLLMDRFGRTLKPGDVVTYPVRPSNGNVVVSDGIIVAIEDGGLLLDTVIPVRACGIQYFQRGKRVRVKHIERVTQTGLTKSDLAWY